MLMGKNKLQKFAAMETYPHVLQYPFAVLEKQGFVLKGRWGKTFFRNDRPIVLELGCGRGEYTVGLARMFPDKNFIGVDIKGARMFAGARQSMEEELGNVAFLRTGIELIHHFFGLGEVDEIWLTFPDPQMKKDRKRLTSTRFMALYQQFLKPGGVIHLKCDSNYMFTYTCAMVEANGLTVEECTEDLYRTHPDDPVLSIRTAYEQQWLERGLDIRYLRFAVSPRETWIEPDIEIEPDPYRSFNRSRRGGEPVSDL